MAKRKRKPSNIARGPAEVEAKVRELQGLDMSEWNPERPTRPDGASPANRGRS